MSPEFRIWLPKGTNLMIAGPHNALISDTPTFAELIHAIAESPEFKAHAGQKEVLKKLAREIAGRWSGH